jgi:hypothetical protein
MKSPKLIVNNQRGLVRLAWLIPDMQDIGGNLGDVAPKDVDDRDERVELEAMHKAALLTAGAQKDRDGFHWPSERAARSALSSINAAARAARAGKPWPDWAIKARAAGWKPPKGWKP